MILGLLGPAGAGKSTVAEYLCRVWGAQRFAFGDPLKDLCQRAFLLTNTQVYGSQAEKEAIDPRYGVSPRWLMTRLGTEGCRAVFGENFWIEQTLRRISLVRPTLAVIEDVRFINEAAAIQSAGGIVWRLETIGRDSAADSSHASESEYLRAPYDRIIKSAVSAGAVDLLTEVQKELNNSALILRAFSLA